MDDYNRIERRKFPRLAASVVINYSIIDAGLPKSAKAETKNIGAGGICMTFYEDINEGAELLLKVYLPDDPSFIIASGKIVWKEKFEISSDSIERFNAGVEFIEIKESDRDKISKYVFAAQKQKS